MPKSNCHCPNCPTQWPNENQIAFEGHQYLVKDFKYPVKDSNSLWMKSLTLVETQLTCCMDPQLNFEYSGGGGGGGGWGEDYNVTVT